MRIRNALYFFAVVFAILCNNGGTFCKEIDIPSEPEQLRLFLLKGYTSAKSVFDDLRIEYELKHKKLIDLELPKEQAGMKITYSSYDTSVEEYIHKNGKERWVFLYIGESSPEEDVSYRTDFIGKENSPRFKVFDGQYILEYTSLKDSFTNVGRASLDASKTGFFESSGLLRDCAPVKFFGYLSSRMPDDVLLSPKVDIETKPEIIDGLLTYKISAPIDIPDYTYEMTYWLSPERSCLPVKIEVWVNGKFRRRLETKEFIELEDGRWAIKSILQRNFIHRESEEGPREIFNIIYTIRKVVLHPEIDEDNIFNTSPDSLPKGAQIIDNRSDPPLRYINYPAPTSLICKKLPELKDLGINLSLTDVNDKSMLVVFFDMEQRPSRNCILQLSKRAQELRAKDIVIIAVQASKIERAKLDEWTKENDIPFKIGMVEGDSEKIRFNWGVKSLPWLILTDDKHVVTAEGFGLDELDEKSTH